MQPKVWNSSLFQQDRPASASQGQGGSSIPSHALVVLRTVTGSLWAPWMAEERRERRCAEQFLREVLDLYLKAEIHYSPKTQHGVARNFFSYISFSLLSKLPRFCTISAACLGCRWAWRLCFRCAACAIRNIHLLPVSCTALGLRGCAPSSVSLAKVDKLYPCSAQHPVSITASAGFLRRV